MKKLFLVSILAAAIVLSSCGGSNIPKGMTKETYDNGCRALEIMEKYNNAEISKEDAKDRLNSLSSALEKEHDKLTDVIESSNAFLVSSDISLFIHAIGGAGSKSTYDLETDLRDKLEK